MACESEFTIKSAELLGNTEKEIIMNRYSPSPTQLTSSVPPTTIQRDNGGGARSRCPSPSRRVSAEEQVQEKEPLAR